MPKPSLSQIREGNFVYSLINFADVRRGEGGIWPNVDKSGQGGREGRFLPYFCRRPLWMTPIAIVCRPSVCPSVCLSVTLMYAEHIRVG